MNTQQVQSLCVCVCVGAAHRKHDLDCSITAAAAAAAALHSDRLPLCNIDDLPPHSLLPAFTHQLRLKCCRCKGCH